MLNRKEHISDLINIIQGICWGAEISLVPYKCKDGTYVTGVHDHLEDKIYVLSIDREEVPERR